MHSAVLRPHRYGHSFSGFDNRFLVLVPGKLFVFGGKVEPLDSFLLPCATFHVGSVCLCVLTIVFRDSCLAGPILFQSAGHFVHRTKLSSGRWAPTRTRHSRATLLRLIMLASRCSVMGSRSISSNPLRLAANNHNRSGILDSIGSQSIRAEPALRYSD